jgi:voltage-gated potassium channel
MGRRRLDKKIDRLKNHYIICGYGRIGRVLCNNLSKSSLDMGAENMAQRILRPTVTNFLDLALAYEQNEIQMEEIPVSASSQLADVMLKDSGIRQEYNLILIAIKKADGTMQFNPSFESIIQAGETVIAVGEKKNLQLLEAVLNP